MMCKCWSEARYSSPFYGQYGEAAWDQGMGSYESCWAAKQWLFHAFFHVFRRLET